MGFEREHEKFIENQKKNRSGESLRRLVEGHSYLERLFLQQVWWPVVGHFEYLHAEYEVNDLQQGSRFLDFAYLRPPYRICFELDGYGPHLKDLNRWQFADQLQRQNHLIFDEWKLFRFSLDDIKEKPQRCQLFVQQLLGKYYSSTSGTPYLSRRERQLAQLFVHLGQTITPGSAADSLQLNKDHTRRLLSSLQAKGIIISSSGKQRIRSYELNPDGGRVKLE